MLIESSVIEVSHLTKIFSSGPSYDIKLLQVKALSNLNFTIQSGEVVGVIGENGSGKSTLLKILGGILKPTSGEIRLKGKVGSVLDIGAGFHQDLSGHENIFLSGTILGMHPHEIKKSYNDIVQYSGIKQYIHLPVKYYSSGMYMRLAFSIIVHLNSDILLLDEVMAVGDAEFKIKSQNKIEEMCKSGTTVVIAGHDLRSIQTMCSRCIMLENGKIKMDGKSQDIISFLIEKTVIKAKATEDSELMVREGKNAEDKYGKETDNHEGNDLENSTVISNETIKERKERTFSEFKKETETILYRHTREWKEKEIEGSDHIRMVSARIFSDIQGEVLYAGDTITIEIEYKKLTNTPSYVGLMFYYQLINPSFLANPLVAKSNVTGELFDSKKGDYITRCIIPRFLLNKGSFSFDLFFMKNATEYLHVEKGVLYFKVEYKAAYEMEIQYKGESAVAALPTFFWEKKLND